jgi:hypothetical protein
MAPDKDPREWTKEELKAEMESLQRDLDAFHARNPEPLD